MGIRLAERLAARIPAMRADSMTFPLAKAPVFFRARAILGPSRTTAWARAVRSETGFAPTSTMRTCPDEVRWERLYFCVISITPFHLKIFLLNPTRYFLE